MKMLNSLRNRVGAAAFAVGALAPHGEQSKDAPVRVTPADVQWSNQKVAGAYGALVDMWTNGFQADRRALRCAADRSIYRSGADRVRRHSAEQRAVLLGRERDLLRRSLRRGNGEDRGATSCAQTAT